MATRIPDARLVIFENSGHFIHVEEPELFQQTIREFLEGVFATTGVFSSYKLATTWAEIKSD